LHPKEGNNHIVNNVIQQLVREGEQSRAPIIVKIKSQGVSPRTVSKVRRHTDLTVYGVHDKKGDMEQR
jgi:hypothetical protein